MKYIIYIFFICLLGIIASCENGKSGETSSDAVSDHEHAHDANSIHLSQSQFETMKMEVDVLPKRNLAHLVKANGTLEVPPKSEAIVTAILGANIKSIEVIEGENVKKGQVLAYLAHPNLIDIQSRYLEALNRKSYLEQDYKRQEELYNKEVGSGKDFQQTTADYRSAQASVKSLEAQLLQLGMNAARIANDNFYHQIPVLSPIDGSITKVDIKTGQYVAPSTALFEIINIEHIHADLMVFEKDIHKVKKGQRVRFKVQSMPEQTLFAEIYAVGKKFEHAPKAIHLHAEIENKMGVLIPGMFVSGEILTDSTNTLALPESAITRDGNDFFVFSAEKEGKEWSFSPIRISTGIRHDGWVEIKLIDELATNSKVALNNAYYLLAEMKKEDGAHHH